MQRVLIRRLRGRGLVLLGASVQAWYGPAPTPAQMARLLDLERGARMARATYVRPVVRREAVYRAGQYRRALELWRDPVPPAWHECAWVVVLHEPTTAGLQQCLAAFTARAEQTVVAMAPVAEGVTR